MIIEGVLFPVTGCVDYNLNVCVETVSKLASTALLTPLKKMPLSGPPAPTKIRTGDNLKPDRQEPAIPANQAQRIQGAGLRCNPRGCCLCW